MRLIRYLFFIYRISLSRAWSVIQSREQWWSVRRGRDGPEVHSDGGVRRGDRWASRPNRGDRLFSLAVSSCSFVLPSFSFACLLWPPFPSSWRAPCESVYIYLRLLTLVLPRCTCRAHESVERGGRIKLQLGECVLGKVETTLNPFIPRMSVLRIRLWIGKRNREKRKKWERRNILQRHRKNCLLKNLPSKKSSFRMIF